MNPIDNCPAYLTSLPVTGAAQGVALIVAAVAVVVGVGLVTARRQRDSRTARRGYLAFAVLTLGLATFLGQGPVAQAVPCPAPAARTVAQAPAPEPTERPSEQTDATVTFPDPVLATCATDGALPTATDTDGYTFAWDGLTLTATARETWIVVGPTSRTYDQPQPAIGNQSDEPAAPCFVPLAPVCGEPLRVSDAVEYLPITGGRADVPTAPSFIGDFLVVYLGGITGFEYQIVGADGQTSGPCGRPTDCTDAPTITVTLWYFTDVDVFTGDPFDSEQWQMLLEQTLASCGGGGGNN